MNKDRKKILYMHTGSGNHGCEALLRSSAELLGGPESVDLWSLSPEEDKKYGASKSVGYVYSSEELKKGSLAYFQALIGRRLLKRKDANMDAFLKELFSDAVAVSIGGDNYCYSWSAGQGIELDKKIRRYCAANVLWGCSIDPEAITDEMREDLRGFDLITAREPITYELLKAINPNTVKVADPAFLLDRKELPLPEGFAEGNTVGINVSPLIMKYGTDGNLILDNYRELMRWILDETDMSICLIPHVVWEYNNDRQPLELLYNEFKESGRVCRIDDANCEELKGYIARCRFFVGARTHATIAAYSSLVPTLVVGYSVKSRGIAMDLFGTEENYVLSVRNMKSSSDLKIRFEWTVKNEKEQIRQLEKVIPAYMEEARKGADAVEQLLK